MLNPTRLPGAACRVDTPHKKNRKMSKSLLNQDMQGNHHVRQKEWNGGDEGWVESVMEVSRICNKLFSRHTCGVCRVYADKQVEFESRQEDKPSAQPHYFSMDSLFMKASGIPHLDQKMSTGSEVVDVCRQDLFDEGSVVDGASSRIEDDEDATQSGFQRAAEMADEHSVITHRTS